MPAKRHPDHEPHEPPAYEYPAHLRHAVTDLPAAPGVYTLRAEPRVLPGQAELALLHSAAADAEAALARTIHSM